MLTTSLDLHLRQPCQRPRNKYFFCSIAHSTSETAALLQNKPLVYPDTIFKLTPRYYENQRQGNYLKDFHQRIIDERREILRNNNNNKSEEEGYSIFIDHILTNEGMFSDADIQDHVITVLSAGNIFINVSNFSRSMSEREISLVSFLLRASSTFH